jgi:hypothetical protein
MNKPPNKSQGRSVMTSDFVEPLGGVVRYNDEVWDEIKEREDIKEEIAKHGEERARRAGAILDTSRDGYYTTEKVIPDFLKVNIYIRTLHNLSLAQLCPSLSLYSLFVHYAGSADYQSKLQEQICTSHFDRPFSNSQVNYPSIFVL